jgi:hypothetical protein
VAFVIFVGRLSGDAAVTTGRPVDSCSRATAASDTGPSVRDIM